MNMGWIGGRILSDCIRKDCEVIVDLDLMRSFGAKVGAR